MHDQQTHPAVPAEDVLWLNEMISRNEQQPLPFHDALMLLGNLSNAILHITGVFCSTRRKETTAEVLKSIMAIYLFHFEIERISKLDVDPANFKDFLYQPEKDV